ncbi:MAG TPA: hypothetical protein DIT25_00495 [Candidatus Moranbacteria bacterium]|nr:hypothetical protein [Candidatus Moranbacteria bacterium]
MRGKPITNKEIGIIGQLRKTGHSLPEICKIVGRRNSTVHRYAKEIVVLPKYVDILREKQGGSKKRAEKCWGEAKIKAKNLLKNITERDKLLILAALYWGEGTKKELNIINSDPILVKVFISCLKEIGVKEKDFRISLRVYSDINIKSAKKYWAKVCNVDMEQILNVNILSGKKIGKLPYGMCRIRVSQSGKSFKLIMSLIEFIKMETIN